MRILTVLLCTLAIGALGATASTAVAEEGSGDSFICESGQGVFVDVSPLVYVCLFPDQTTPDSVHAGRQACQSGRGLFVLVNPATYACLFPGNHGYGGLF
jgi:hypothetical protein